MIEYNNTDWLYRHDDKIIRSRIAPDLGLPGGIVVVIFTVLVGLVISNVVLRFSSGFCSACQLTRRRTWGQETLGKKCNNIPDLELELSANTEYVSEDIWSIHHKFNLILLTVSCTNVPLF